MEVLRLSRRRQLRRGDLVEVRSASDILATLDENACLEGVPFMPEMLPSIGRRFTVTARTERACDTINKGGRVRRLPDTVILDDLRCDGSGHDGCDAGCRLYWKEAWLRRVDDRAGAEPPSEEGLGALTDLTTRATRTDDAPTYRCQATEFVRASEELRRWDFGSFFRELTTRNVSLPEFVRVAAQIFVDGTSRHLGRWSYPVKPAAGGSTTADAVGVPPGTRVKIRSQQEIEQTLGPTGKNRGLWFDREMLPYCGKQVSVKARVNRFIDEASGRMVVLKSDCLILDGVVCRSHLSDGRWFCPRAIYPWWREAWLQPLEETVLPAAADADVASESRRD